MSTDDRERLERRAEVVKSELARTIDALADRKLIHKVASVVLPSAAPAPQPPARLRYLALGLGAGVALALAAFGIVHLVRR